MWCFSTSDVVYEKHRQYYDMLMPCECQACLSCLHRAGKLPEGSTLPKDLIITLREDLFG